MLCGGLGSVFGLVPHCYAQHVELITLVFLVSGLDVGNLPLAWAAPACPEIHQDILALSYVVGEFCDAPGRLCYLKVGEHGAFFGACHQALCLFGLCCRFFLGGSLLATAGSQGDQRHGCQIKIFLHIRWNYSLGMEYVKLKLGLIAGSAASGP